MIKDINSGKKLGLMLIHQPIQTVVLREYGESHKSGEILILPRDKRYDRNDIYQIAAVIVEASGW